MRPVQWPSIAGHPDSPEAKKRMVGPRGATPFPCRRRRDRLRARQPGRSGMRRRQFIAGLGSAAAWPVVSRAQQAAMPVIGWLNSVNSASGGITAALLEFLQGLKETGFVEGQNVVIEYRLLRTNPICRRSQPISSAVV